MQTLFPFIQKQYLLIFFSNYTIYIKLKEISFLEVHLTRCSFRKLNPRDMNTRRSYIFSKQFTQYLGYNRDYYVVGKNRVTIWFYLFFVFFMQLYISMDIFFQIFAQNRMRLINHYLKNSINLMIWVRESLKTISKAVCGYLAVLKKIKGLILIS